MGAKLADGETCCRDASVVIVSVLCTGASVTALVFSYLRFWGPAPVIAEEGTTEELLLIMDAIPVDVAVDCSWNHGLIIATTVMCAVVFLLGFPEGTSMLTHSIVNAWLVSLLCSALAAPNSL